MQIGDRFTTRPLFKLVARTHGPEEVYQVRADGTLTSVLTFQEYFNGHVAIFRVLDKLVKYENFSLTHRDITIQQVGFSVQKQIQPVAFNMPSLNKYLANLPQDHVPTLGTGVAEIADAINEFRAMKKTVNYILPATFEAHPEIPINDLKRIISLMLSFSPFVSAMVLFLLILSMIWSVILTIGAIKKTVQLFPQFRVKVNNLHNHLRQRALLHKQTNTITRTHRRHSLEPTEIGLRELYSPGQIHTL